MTSTAAAERASPHGFVGAAALLVAASATMTYVWCSSMSALGGMAMAGGWTMSMTWMRMPGQSWRHAAASFLGMWDVMMVAMMLPSLVPTLRRFRESVAGASGMRPDLLAALAGVGYFAVWTVAGAAAFPLGAMIASAELHRPAVARAAPLAVGVVVLLAGMCQRTAWKARLLARCHTSGPPHRSSDAGAAWRHGVRHGAHCVRCCANLVAMLLVLGVMDVRAMAVLGLAGVAERLAPAGDRVARATGAVAVGVGLLLIARAAPCVLNDWMW